MSAQHPPSISSDVLIPSPQTHIVGGILEAWAVDDEFVLVDETFVDFFLEPDVASGPLVVSPAGADHDPEQDYG